MVPDIDNLNGVDMADIASINGQDAPSGGGTASTTPSVALSSASGGFGYVVATITKSGGGTYTNPNYSATAVVGATTTVADAVVNRSVEADESHLSGVLTFTDTNATAGTRTLSVRAQEFGATVQSAAATATYDLVYCQKEYVRFQACDSSGSNTASQMAFSDIRLFTGVGQTGTEYPTTDLTANDSETDIVISMGGYYGSYEPWKGADSAATDVGGWALTSGADLNWWQIQFEDGTYDTKPIIKSIQTRHYSSYHGTHLKITGSDNADHSSATTFGIFPTVGLWAINNHG